MSADTNGDGVIDFEEFMKHFPDILNCIQFQNNLDSTYEKVKAAELARLKLSGNENLDDVGSLAQKEIKKLNGTDGKVENKSGSTFMAM